LRLDRPSRDEFNIMLADPYCPLPHCFFALKDVCQWPIEYDSNNMGQEVVHEIPGRHEDCVEQLLNCRAPCLSVLQDVTDKVHGLLLDFHCGFKPFNGDNYADNCVGSCNV
jgi:hypothetical protein